MQERPGGNFCAMNQHSETTVLDDFIIVTDAQRSALQRRGVKDLYSLLECVVEAHGPAEDVGLPAEVVAVYKRHLINWIRDYGLGAYVDLLAANGAGRIRLFGQFPKKPEDSLHRQLRRIHQD
mgnify:CR=1 FL=1